MLTNTTAEQSHQGNKIEITTSEVTFRSFDGKELSAYLARPAGGKISSYPAIVIAHDALGVREPLRRLARQYAENGYVAIAPAYYSRYGDILTEENVKNVMDATWTLPHQKQKDVREIEGSMQRRMTDKEKEAARILNVEKRSMQATAQKDVLSCNDYFISSGSVAKDRVGITGFSQGGGMAFNATTEFPFTAAVIIYGGNPEAVNSVEKITAEVCCLYPGECATCVESIQPTIEGMLKYKKNFEMKIYKGAAHGFFNEERTAYNKEAAADSWEKSLAFFNKQLM